MYDMKKRNYLILFFVACACACIIVIGLPTIYFFRSAEGELIPYPDPNLQKTAEYFYYNPPLLPSEITQISGDINSQREQLCAYGDFAKYYFSSSWFINGEKIPNWMYSFAIMGDVDQSGYLSCLTSHLHRWLYPGFHLIEIHWESYLFDVDTSYKFGVKINDVLATPLPTLIPQTP
jgi:hypothetical protein